jgi:hypothetical protein
LIYKREKKEVSKEIKEIYHEVSRQNDRHILQQLLFIVKYWLLLQTKATMKQKNALWSWEMVSSRIDFSLSPVLHGSVAVDLHLVSMFDVDGER